MSQRPLQFLSPIHKATRQITLHLQEEVEACGVSPKGGHLMTYLAGYAPCPVGELSRVFGMGKSTLTGLLDRLEEGGFVTRTLNPDDRRSFIVDITPAGRRTATRLRGILEALEKDIADRVSSTDLKGFHRVMAAIAEATRVDVRPAPSGKEKEKSS